MATTLKSVTQQCEERVQQRLQELKEREKRWEELEKKVELMASKPPSKVVLDVGGKRFAAAKSTLLTVPDTFFTAMLSSDNWKPDEAGVYFIDRSPKHFGRILDYLRIGKLRVADLHEEQLERYEAIVKR